MMLWDRVLAALRYLCLIYFAVIALGFGLSLLLPSFEHIPETRDQACYWTDAMIAFVECGARAPGGTIREVIYNLWLSLIYAPVFAFSVPIAAAATGALYAPFLVFFILSIKMRKIRQAS
jgi:hypothetical protein